MKIAVDEAAICVIRRWLIVVWQTAVWYHHTWFPFLTLEMAKHINFKETQIALSLHGLSTSASVLQSLFFPVEVCLNSCKNSFVNETMIHPFEETVTCLVVYLVTYLVEKIRTKLSFWRNENMPCIRNQNICWWVN
jgi:hypothetical protein